MPFPENRVYFDEFMKNKKILHIETAVTSSDGLKILSENEKKCDMITFNTVEKITYDVDSTSRVNRDGIYYYSHEFTNDCDIIDNVRVELLSPVNFSLSYIIGGLPYEFEKVTELLLASTKHHVFKLRINFQTTPQTGGEIKLYCRKYLMKPQDKDWLVRYPIQTKHMRYMSGLCGSIYEHNVVY
jgi:hypothetical protein